MTALLKLLLPIALCIGAQSARCELIEAPSPSPSEIPTALKGAGGVGLSVDTLDRNAVRAFYNDVYLPGESVGADWSGSTGSCTPGTTSAAYLTATATRINFYRAMAGLPGNIQLDPTLNARCQEAALMMSAENRLSHSPPATWACFSADGALAAARSNLSLGNAGPQSIDAYMEDRGAGNRAAGHRRWILDPGQTIMGSGSVSGNGARAANALWVINGGSDSGVSQPASWPSMGFFPKPLIIARWSYSHPQADFSGATVRMFEDGEEKTLVQNPISNGFGDNTLVWEPQIGLPPPGADVTYRIEISGMRIGGVVQPVAYDVIAIDITGGGSGEGEGEGNTAVGCVQSKLADAGIHLNGLFGDLFLWLLTILTLYTYPALR